MKNKLFDFLILQALILLAAIIVFYPLLIIQEEGHLPKEATIKMAVSERKIEGTKAFSKNDLASETFVKNEPLEKLTIADIYNLVAAADLETDSFKRREMYREIAKKWSTIDSDSCLNWGLALVSPLDKSSVLIATVSHIVVLGDIIAALELVEKIPRGEFKDDVIVCTISAIAKDDINKALNLVNSLSGEGAFRSAAGDLAKVLTKQGEFGEMQEIWEKIPYGSFRDEFGFFMVHNICRESPEKALKWVLGNSDFFNSENAIRRVASEYAKQDPAAAMDTANLIVHPGLKYSYLQELGRAWGRADPTLAGEWLLRVTAESGYDTNKLLGDGIIAEWVQWDHVNALTALDSIQDPSARNQAKLAALKALASFDPAGAANTIMPLLSPESIESRNAIRKLTSNWMQRDPLAASQWVGSLGEGPLKDVSIDELVSNILSKDRDIVMANSWAAQIKDRKIRAQANANIDRTKP